MNKITRAALTLGCICLIAACSKSNKTTCSNAEALNYQQSGDCVYAKDKILPHGGYKVKVTKYTLQPLQVGDSFEVNVSNSPCIGGPGDAYTFLQLVTLGGAFQPNSFCVGLNGFDFNITDSMNIQWSGAPVTGQGHFDNQGASFSFSGIVHSSDGDSVIELRSY